MPHVPGHMICLIDSHMMRTAYSTKACKEQPMTPCIDILYKLGYTNVKIVVLAIFVETA